MLSQSVDFRPWGLRKVSGRGEAERGDGGLSPGVSLQCLAQHHPHALDTHKPHTGQVLGTPGKPKMCVSSTCVSCQAMWCDWFQQTAVRPL